MSDVDASTVLAFGASDHRSMKLLLPQIFYKRDSLIVARDLIGKHLIIGEIVLKISETEAYRWPDDSANHCFRGKTNRNSPMFGPAGHLYMYLCYGLHHMLNITTNDEGEGAAVLIRAAEPMAGFKILKSSQGSLGKAQMLNGPGKLTKALGLDLSFNRHSVFTAGGLEVHQGPSVTSVSSGPRIGIDYAHEKDRNAHYRFVLA